ncbi:hypothetical protein F4813DRAFT_398037, partial [Daldinia decipiens]|uniref:uncharacterized protein n=1 Tax=Daldinia decipiens TaxID=326647 RepID=UPI0020C3897C
TFPYSHSSSFHPPPPRPHPHPHHQTRPPATAAIPAHTPATPPPAEYQCHPPGPCRRRGSPRASPNTPLSAGSRTELHTSPGRLPGTGSWRGLRPGSWAAVLRLSRWRAGRSGLAAGGRRRTAAACRGCWGACSATGWRPEMRLASRTGLVLSAWDWLGPGCRRGASPRTSAGDVGSAPGGWMKSLWRASLACCPWWEGLLGPGIEYQTSEKCPGRGSRTSARRGPLCPRKSPRLWEGLVCWGPTS